MAFKGDLNSISLADLLHTISISQKEGTLIVSDGDNRKLIYFTSDGISLVSSGKRKCPRIGEMLVKSGKITESQLEQVLEQQKSSGRKTGEILISSGLVLEQDVASAVKSQIEEEFYDLFYWEHATFEFVEGPPSQDLIDPEAPPHSISLDVNALLTEAAHRLDQWHLFHDVIPNTKAIFAFTAGEAPVLPDEAEKGLQEVVGLIDGKRTVEDIIAQSGLTRFDACRYIYTLFAQKMLKRLGFADTAPEDAAKIESQEQPKIDIHHEIAQLLEQASKLPPKDLKRLLPIYQKILQLDPTRVSVKIKLDKLVKESKKARRRLLLRLCIFIPLLLILAAAGYAVKYELDVRKKFEAVKADAGNLESRDDLVGAKTLYEDFAARYPYNLISKEALKDAADIQAKIIGRQRQAEEKHKKEIQQINDAFEQMLARENEYSIEQFLQASDNLAAQAKAKDALELYSEITKKQKKLANYAAEAEKFYVQGMAFEQSGDYEKANQMYVLILKNYPRSSRVSETNFVMSIESVPSGADVYINDQKFAVTPFVLRYKPGSQFEVKLFRGGFAPAASVIDSRNYLSQDTPAYKCQLQLEKTLKWKFETRGIVLSRPVEKSGVLYFGSRDGSIYALDIAGEKELWSLSTPTTADIESSPVIFDNNIFIGCNDSFLYSVDLQTRKFVWNFKTQLFVKSAPLISPNGKVLYVGSSDGNVYAIEPKTASTVYWTAPVGAPVTAQPVLYSNTIFVGTDAGKISAINAVSGEVLWISNDTAGSFASSPAIYDNVLYAGSTNGIIYALDMSSGSVLWTFKANGAIYSTPAFHKELVIFSSAENRIFAVNLQSHLEQWTITTGGPVVSSGTIDGEIYYTGCEDGAIYAVNCSAGEILWKYKTTAPIHAAPLVTDNFIFIGSDDKCMYVLDK